MELDENRFGFEMQRSWKTFTITATAVVVCALLMLHPVLHGSFDESPTDLTLYSSYFCLLPLLLLGAIAGFNAGILCAFVLVFVKCLYIMDFDYSLCTYLGAVCLAWLFSKNRFFRSFYLTVVAAAVYSLLLGGLRDVLQEMVEGRGLDTYSLSLFLRESARMFPTAAFAAFLTLVFMKAAPDRWKAMLTGSFLYTESYENYEKLLRSDGKRHSHMNSKLLLLSVVKSVCACVFAGVYASILLQTMGMEQLFYTLPGSSIPYITNEGLAFDVKLILLMLMTVIPIIIFVSWFCNIFIIDPVRRMSQFMRGFERTTDQTRKGYVHRLHQLKVSSHDEVADLYHSIDRSISEINIFIEALERDQKLSEDLRVAQASNEAKSTFLSNMSHEIRTPINSVLGFDEMILRESHEPDVISYATDIKNSGKILLNLVNDILDFSKIEAGKMEIIPFEYELSSMINDLVNMITIRTKEKGLELRLEVDENTPHLLFGDEMRLKQVILNILTNAVKYTRRGSVTFRLGYEKVSSQYIMLRVHVIDTGIGIKADELQRMFRPFERVDEVRNRTIEGTGLGMSIIRGLLQQMDSGIEVSSEYGKGSDFSFAVRQRVISWGPIGNFTTRFEHSAEKKEAYHELFRAPTARVLVVDDTKLNLTVFCGLLKNTKMQIDTAESGLDMLELVRQKDYDMLFIDHRMPEMDGIEALEELRRLEGNHNAQVPCIALTANAINGAREMYLEAGFTDYLSKPVNGKTLEKLLVRYLPPEKVSIVHDDQIPQDVSVTTTTADTAAIEEFSRIEGIDAAVALSNCGSREVLSSALRDFYDAIPTKAFTIENLLSEKNIRDYTVLVHALKSSSRLIGALKLSKDAEYLEKCGDESNLAELEAKTPALLADYRSYRDKLEPFCAPAPQSQTAAEDDAPVMTGEEFAEAMVGIRDFVDMADFSNAQEILSQMQNFSMPEDFAKKHAQVTALVRAADRNAVLDLIAGFLP